MGNISIDQVELMKHAIGLTRKRIKAYKYNAFRNYYTTPDTHHSWEYLVHIGYAVSNDFKNGVGKNPKMYSVTRKGMDLLEQVTFIKITEGE